MLTVRRILLVVTVGLILSGVLAYGSPWVGSDSASAADGGAEVRLVVKEGGACDGDACTVPRGAAFTLAVEIVGIPEGGWVLLQTFLSIGTDLDYQPPEVSSEEYVSPACVATGTLAFTGQGELAHGCRTGLQAPLPPSTYAGNFIELEMSCPDADSSTEVRLLLFGDPIARTGGALFLRPDNTNVIPKVSNVTVNCGSGTPPPDTATPTRTPTPTPSDAELRLTVKEGGACDDDACTVPQGASFTLAVEIVGIPDGGYFLLTSLIVMGPDLVYHPPEVAMDEYTWPDCVSRAIRLSGLMGRTLWHGCFTDLLPPLPLSTYTGNYIELKMSCPDADSSTEVQLLPKGDPNASWSGAVFGTADGTAIPKVSNLTINCGSAPEPTHTPRPPTATPSPPTPTPNRFLTGDADCDGAVDAMDASLILRFDAGLLRVLLCPEKVDVNGDGLLNSLDALLILQFTAQLIEQLPAAYTE